MFCRLLSDTSTINSCTAHILLGDLEFVFSYSHEIYCELLCFVFCAGAPSNTIFDEDKTVAMRRRNMNKYLALRMFSLADHSLHL